MDIEILKSKIHRATVTDSDLTYVGSITIDEDLLEEVNIIQNERVGVYNLNNGERFDTYVLRGKRGSGIICVNGAGARKVMKGDIIIILAYARMSEQEAHFHEPKIVFPDENNNF